MHADGETFKCDYCKSVYVPGQDDEGVRLLGAGPGDECPVCSIPLMQASLAKISILSCTKCRGMLLPMETFQTLVEAVKAQQPGGTAVEPPADPAALRRTVACPHCHRPMEAHFYGGAGNVVIDSCEPCLLNWLDHGEISRIAHGPDSFANATDLDVGLES
jgi:Zn-finger nucleic acid-binding protein